MWGKDGGETEREGVVIRVVTELRPCGTSVCRVLIQ